MGRPRKAFIEASCNRTHYAQKARLFVDVFTQTTLSLRKHDRVFLRAHRTMFTCAPYDVYVNTVRKLREHRTVRIENIGCFMQRHRVFLAKASE